MMNYYVTAALGI